VGLLQASPILDRVIVDVRQPTEHQDAMDLGRRVTLTLAPVALKDGTSGEGHWVDQGHVRVIPWLEHVPCGEVDVLIVDDD
jgi:hypothetical protein